MSEETMTEIEFSDTLRKLRKVMNESPAPNTAVSPMKCECLYWARTNDPDEPFEIGMNKHHPKCDGTGEWKNNPLRSSTDKELTDRSSGTEQGSDDISPNPDPQQTDTALISEADAMKFFDKRYWSEFECAVEDGNWPELSSIVFKGMAAFARQILAEREAEICRDERGKIADDIVELLKFYSSARNSHAVREYIEKLRGA